MEQQISLMDFLQEIKESRGKTIKDICTVCGINRSYLYKISRGSEPSPELGQKLSAITGGRVPFRVICPRFAKQMENIALIQKLQ